MRRECYVAWPLSCACFPDIVREILVVFDFRRLFCFCSLAHSSCYFKQFLSLKKRFKKIICTSVLPAFVCVTCVSGIYRSQKTAKDPGAGIIGGCEP